MHGAAGQAVLEPFQLAGDQSLGLSQRRMAALDALVHLLHRCLGVFTAVGAAPEHEALHLPDVLSLHTFHHGVHSLLHSEPDLGLVFQSNLLSPQGGGRPHLPP